MVAACQIIFQDNSINEDNKPVKLLNLYRPLPTIELVGGFLLTEDSMKRNSIEFALMVAGKAASSVVMRFFKLDADLSQEDLNDIRDRVFDVVFRKEMAKIERSELGKLL